MVITIVVPQPRLLLTAIVQRAPKNILSLLKQLLMPIWILPPRGNWACVRNMP